MICLRQATVQDAKRLSEIYNYYILKDSTSYECQAVSVEKFADRISHYSEQYPYLVAYENDEIVGYAYATRYRERKAFDWSCEISVYLDNTKTGKGIGSILMEKLLHILEKCNYANIYSLVNYPNDGSEKLHKKFGFKECGRFNCVGFKMGEWRTLVQYEKRLTNTTNPPKEIDMNWAKYL